MSKGTPKHFVRLSDELMLMIEKTIDRRNLHTREEPWDLSAFMRVAFNEKIKKMARSRRRKGGCLTPQGKNTTFQPWPWIA